MIATANERETARISAALHSAPVFSRGRFARALLCTLLLPATIYFLIFALTLCRSDAIRRLGLSKFGPVLDYGYAARNVDADVVVFGDSSAFLGVDPRIVNAAAHVRMAVLPDTIGSLPLTDDLPLRKYLAHNRPPRTIIFYFSPWNLDYRSIKPEFVLEGEEELLRYGSWRDIALALWHAPRLLAFPFQTLEPLGLRHVRNAVHGSIATGDDTFRSLGHSDYTLRYEPLQRPCAVRREYTRAFAHTTVRDLEAKYARLGIHVVGYMAPVPDCTNTAELVHRSYADVDAGPPAVLPASWFADDSFTAHILPGHVRESSLLFAHTMQSELAGARR